MWYGINICRKTKQSWEIYAVQTPRLVTFPAEFITGTTIDHGNFFDHQKTNLPSQLSFCFRPEWDLLRGVSRYIWRKGDRQTGLWENYWKERTFAPSLGEWEIRAEGKLDILANIPYDSIIDTIFGTALIRVLLSCLNVIGYVGSTYGFIHLIWVHCQKQNAEEEEEEERPESETEWWWAPSLHRVRRLSNNQSQSVISFRTISKSMLWPASKLSNFKVSDLFLH